MTPPRSISEPSKARLDTLRGGSTFSSSPASVISALLSDAATSVDAVFAEPAPVLGIALALAFWTEATGGVRNMIRADIFMLAVLYVLTFLEFLFPQPGLEARLTLQGAQTGVLAVLVGFAGISLGRHLVAVRTRIDLRALEFGRSSCSRSSCWLRSSAISTCCGPSGSIRLTLSIGCSAAL